MQAQLINGQMTKYTIGHQTLSSSLQGCPINRNAQWALESASSRAIIEKELKEVHGFYFQDERPPGILLSPCLTYVMTNISFFTFFGWLGVNFFLTWP